MTENNPEIKSGSIQGRAEALQIILSLNPEEGLDECVESYPIADTGDHGYNWDTDKLKKLFNIGNEYEHSPFCKLAEAADMMYWDMVGKQSDRDMLNSLVRRLIAQIENGKIDKGKHSTLEILKGWVKEKKEGE